jgi:hypothetical protein
MWAMGDAGHFLIEWHDHGREPERAPHPAYPQGIDVDLAGDRTPSCTVTLPYPAHRCGHYLVVCTECLLTVAITTAGRADDPRSLTLPCKKRAVMRV